MKIRLTEQDLYYLVENCVKHTINEMARHYGKDEFIAAARKNMEIDMTTHTFL